jgi:hypothetical protein
MQAASKSIIHTRYIDYVSQILNHDADYVIDRLHSLIQQHLIPNHINKVHVWTDKGPHFHCAQLAYDLLYSIPTRYSISVSWNTFIEHHGKTAVDAHFSLLSRWLKEAETQRHIITTADLLEVWREKATAHGCAHTVVFHEYHPVCGHQHEHLQSNTSGSRDGSLGVCPAAITGSEELRRVEGKILCSSIERVRHYLTIPPQQWDACYTYHSYKAQSIQSQILPHADWPISPTSYAITKTAESKPLSLAPRLQQRKSSGVSNRQQQAMNVRLAERRVAVGRVQGGSSIAVDAMDVDHVGPTNSYSNPNTPEAALAATDHCIRIAAFAAAHHLAYSLY